jgi:hypothetical protein
MIFHLDPVFVSYMGCMQCRRTKACIARTGMIVLNYVGLRLVHEYNTRNPTASGAGEVEILYIEEDT